MRKLILLSAILLASGCTTMAPEVVPDSVAPDGRTYAHIFWPKQGKFWPRWTSPQYASLECLIGARYA